MNRRVFLIRSGAALGVLGLGYLVWESGTKGPWSEAPMGPLLKAALERANAENKACIAVRIPADPERRLLPGLALIAHLNRNSPDSLDLFAEAVFVCLESSVIQEQVHGADSSHAMILLDRTGHAAAGVSFDFTQRDLFPEVAFLLLHGEGDRRLAALAGTIRRNTDPSTIAALDRLAGEEDRKTVDRHAATLGPLLVYERRRAAGEPRRSELSAAIWRYLESCDPKSPGPKLPFGVEAQPVLEGSDGDPCPYCGMAFLTPGTRTFVRYLAY